MTLTRSDVFAIQAAIDAYENRFPGMPSPSAEEALAWQACGRIRGLPSGLLLHDALQDVVMLSTGEGAASFKLHVRVVRSTKTGLLDFYYRILTGASPL